MRLTFLLVCLLWALPSAAQEAPPRDGFIGPETPLMRFLERQQAAGRLPEAFLTHRPLSAYEAHRYLDSLQARRGAMPPLERRLLDVYRGAEPAPGAAWGRRVGLFRDGLHLVSLRGDGYGLQLEPVLYLSAGRARQTARAGRAATVPVWHNTRGVRAAGHLGRYLFFETRLEETQQRPRTTAWRDGTAPRQANVQFDGQVYDYLAATGGVGLRTRFVEARFARERPRWGEGPSSLFLSGYAAAYDAFTVRATAGPVQYATLLAGLTDPMARLRSGVALPRKYAAFHQLALHLPWRLRLSLFEAVVFATDTLGARRGFDLSYLNPVILWRAAERDRGSPDNVLLGGGLAWGVVPGLEVQGQLLLDELKVDEIGNGWWGNKWGWQLGLRTAPLPGLLVEGAYTRQRPYLYAHRSALTAYAHFNDGLGHPAGPNTADWALRLDYAPTRRLSAALDLAYTRRGRDTDSLNYGSDVLRSYQDRVADYGVEILQGVRQTHLLAEARVGFELLPGLVLGGALRAERLDDAAAGLDRALTPALLVRWNMPYQSLRW